MKPLFNVVIITKENEVIFDKKIPALTNQEAGMQGVMQAAGIMKEKGLRMDEVIVSVSEVEGLALTPQIPELRVVE